GSVRDLEALPRRKGVVFGAGPTRVRVREGAATLELDVLEDAKTGGFLDQRENHARAAELARGECLDAFSYHGGFALALAPRAARRRWSSAAAPPPTIRRSWASRRPTISSASYCG